MLRVLAVDLGATSARVAAVDLDADPPEIEVIHRYAHAPVDGRWAWSALVAEVERGLQLGLERGRVASIGIDTWGVDYGLLDDRGDLLSPPYSYRHPRTTGWRDVAARIGEERLYRTTGIQLMALNTIFQLAAHDRDELARARRLLLLPELVVHALSGISTGERTSAGTTALVDVATGDWSDDLLAAVDVDVSLMPSIATAGVPVGQWRGVPVHLVGGHDTASAVAALPGPVAPGAAFVSSGTWLLVGREQPDVDTSEWARHANFSNEPAVFAGTRFLKNVMGLWLLERCRARWRDVPLAAAGRLPAGGPVFDASDERFLNPADMEAEVRDAAGLGANADRAAVTRCIVDSLAAAVAGVIDELGGAPEIVMVGGGVHNSLLVRSIESTCGVPVRCGAPEAAALGNAIVQGVALGRYADLDDARIAIGHTG